MWKLAIYRAHWRFVSFRHGRFPRPPSRILATPRCKAPPNDLTPICPCSQAASAAVLAASSLCIAGSQGKGARPSPIGHGMGEADGECEGMGCERERIRASELKRERERGTRIVLQLHGELCVVLSGTCRMHACSSMTDLHPGDAKQSHRIAHFRCLPSRG